MRDAEEPDVNLAQTFEENASRTIAVLDQALRNVRDLICATGHFTLANWLRDKAVLREIGVQLAVADASGPTLTTTTANAPPHVNIADREHFRIQVDATQDRLFISKPVIGRTSGQLSIQFTRRMTTPDGRSPVWWSRRSTRMCSACSVNRSEWAAVRDADRARRHHPGGAA